VIVDDHRRHSRIRGAALRDEMDAAERVETRHGD
jgi:hypothetical protein